MAELPGAVAPVENAPVANTVIAPAAPVVQDKQPIEGEKPVAKTYTDDDVKKTVSERLAKERRRIERMVRAEVERDYYRKLAEEGSTRQPPARDKPEGPPKAEDYKDINSFVRDFVKWERAQELEAEQRERQEREPQQRQEQSQAAYARALRERLSDGPDKHPDFEEVVFADEVPFTDPMVAVIHESDAPVDLAYYLATHLDELKKIAKLPATRQVGELLKIEEKLKAPPKVTAAPAPIVPNDGASAGPKDPAKMSIEDHRKAHRKLINR